MNVRHGRLLWKVRFDGENQRYCFFYCAMFAESSYYSAWCISHGEKGDLLLPRWLSTRQSLRKSFLVVEKIIVPRDCEGVATEGGEGFGGSPRASVLLLGDGRILSAGAREIELGVRDRPWLYPLGWPQLLLCFNVVRVSTTSDGRTVLQIVTLLHTFDEGFIRRAFEI